MAHLLPSSAICFAVLTFAVGQSTLGAEDPKLARTKFTGSPSCSSTSCHGGGTGRNEAVIYERRDRHAVSYGILGKGTSLRIAEALGIVGDPGKSAQCNVCHAPMQGVPLDRLMKGRPRRPRRRLRILPRPAENWLRFHTRPDVNFQQIVAAGLRDLNDIYGRANTCIACHLNLDEKIRVAGHPELYFELDSQCLAEPPHYKDERPALGPRSWLTGQAAALREMSWKLADKRDERLVTRWKAVVWLLGKTDAGKKELPLGENFAAMQGAADKLARDAAKTLWSREQVIKQLTTYVSTRAEFTDPKADKVELRRRAEVLIPAIDRLWQGAKKQGAAANPEMDSALESAALLAREQDDFDPARFASALERLELAAAKLVKP